MRSFILISNKPWHDQMYEWLKKYVPGKWFRILNKDEFTKERLAEISPDRIFIVHWSYAIPDEIFNTWNCIVFHMTDLPFGRGGSPLQNLIERGHDKTKISAIKVEEGMDTGDIYLKAPLSLSGTAEEIFIRSSKIIQGMIKEIVKINPVAKKQMGEIVKFNRRKPEQSNISKLKRIKEVYNYIRMLDCEGYPKAFLETDNFRFEFNKASFKSKKIITANVTITEK